MGRTLTAAGIAFVLHTLAFLFSEIYFRLVVSTGSLFSHGKDIADLPSHVFAGYIALGIAAAVVGMLLERLDHLLWRTDPK